MSHIIDDYKVFYKDKQIGYYRTFSDGTVDYSTAWGCPWDIENELKELGLQLFKALLQLGELGLGMIQRLGDNIFPVHHGGDVAFNLFVLLLTFQDQIPGF